MKKVHIAKSRAINQKKQRIERLAATRKKQRSNRRKIVARRNAAKERPQATLTIEQALVVRELQSAVMHSRQVGSRVAITSSPADILKNIVSLAAFPTLWWLEPWARQDDDAHR